jgi:predicted  nucleic acid-binding Zn-ribbon protein
MSHIQNLETVIAGINKEIEAVKVDLAAKKLEIKNFNDKIKEHESAISKAKDDDDKEEIRDLIDEVKVDKEKATRQKAMLDRKKKKLEETWKTKMDELEKLQEEPEPATKSEDSSEEEEAKAKPKKKKKKKKITVEEAVVAVKTSVPPTKKEEDSSCVIS